MAPDVGLATLGWFSLRRPKSSIARIEAYFNTVEEMREDQMISKAPIFADPETMEWMMNANIQNLETWKKFKENFLLNGTAIVINELHAQDPKHNYESMIQFLRRFYKKTLAVEASVEQVSKALRGLVTNHDDYLYILKFAFLPSMFAFRDMIEAEERIEKHRAIKNKIRIAKENAQRRILEKEARVLKAKCNNLGTAKDNIKKETLEIENEKHDVIIDTGSNINIIDKKVLLEKGIAAEKCEPIKIENIFGTVTSSEEKTNLTVKKNSIKVSDDFIVTDTANKDILIGNPLVTKIKKLEDEFSALKEKFPIVFNKDPSNGIQDFECSIETQPGKIVQLKQRNIPQKYLEGTKLAIEKLIKNNYVERSSSSWYNPIRPVEKSNGNIRITSNMQFLNNITESDKYSIPNILKIIESTQGKRFFTVLDLKDGYYQIPLKPEHRFKTAFYFENKLYQWTRMPQGFKNSPAIFQRIMDTLLESLIGNCCQVYLDDIIIYGKNEKEHDENLNKVLTELTKMKFKINDEKVQFKQRKVKVLGAVINGITQSPIPEKRLKILTFQTPKTPRELMRFLGFANYYRKYIQNLASIAAPLYCLTSKKVKFE